MTSPSHKQYYFLKPLASGGLADVYQCEELIDDEVNREVAVKLLKAVWNSNQKIITQMRTDTEYVSMLGHRCIVPVYDIIAMQGRIAIIMDYVTGIDLETTIAFMRSMKQRIPLKVTLEIVANVADSLDVAYNEPPAPGQAPLRLMHRDIKPSNIMLDVNGLVQILDFGVNQALFDRRESETRELQYGAQEYMAPERLFFEPETPASDIYSLTATLFEMIAGKAFGKAKAKELDHEDLVQRYCNKLLAPIKVGLDIKDELQELLSTGLSFRKEKRPEANEFAQQARRIARSMQGTDLVYWAERAVIHFQKEINKNPLKGGLQGETLSEDSDSVKAPIEEKTIREEVDTGAMRRGAMAELKAALKGGYSLLPEDDFDSHTFKHTFDGLEDTLEKTVQSETSPFEVVDGFTELEEVSEEDTRTGLDSTGNIFSDRVADPSIDSHPPMVINPRGMLESDESIKGSNNASQGQGKLLIIVSLLGFFGSIGAFALYLSKNETPPEVEPKTTIVHDIDLTADVRSSDESTLFVSHMSDPKKIQVKCKGEDKVKSDNSYQVIFEYPKGQSCFVEAQDQNRRKRKTKVDNVQPGIYHCFKDASQDCQKE